MTENTKNNESIQGNAPASPHLVSERIPITVKGQKYVAPAGRHSQQTHRLAQERAAATGNASEKEQHAHDRSEVVAAMNRKAEQKAQSSQKKASGPPKATPEQS